MPKPRRPQLYDLVACYDPDGYWYPCFVAEISIPGNSYNLRFSDGSLVWVGEENVTLLMLEEYSTEPAAQPPPPVLQRTETPDALDMEPWNSSDDEVVMSTPLDDLPAPPPLHLRPPPAAQLLRRASVLPKTLTDDSKKKRYTIDTLKKSWRKSFRSSKRGADK